MKLHTCNQIMTTSFTFQFLKKSKKLLQKLDIVTNTTWFFQFKGGYFSRWSTLNTIIQKNVKKSTSFWSTASVWKAERCIETKASVALTSLLILRKKINQDMSLSLGIESPSAFAPNSELTATNLRLQSPQRPPNLKRTPLMSSSHLISRTSIPPVCITIWKHEFLKKEIFRRDPILIRAAN